MRQVSFASILVAGLIGFATASGAATLTIESNAMTYNVGDTITVTVTGDSEGEIASDNYIHVIVAHDLSKVSADGILVYGQGFTQFDGGVPALVTGGQDYCAWAIGRDNQCPAFAQIPAAEGYPVDAGPKIASFSYTAEAAGIATFIFQDAIGADFNFFSLGNGSDVGTAPAGISVTIVPEPATAALLALGLAGLAARRRNARRRGCVG